MTGLPLAKRAGAEAAGTALLLAAVVGSGVMAERLAGDAAVALLANTLATCAALAALIVAFGPTSGAHFNPAVTVAMILRRRVPPRDGAVYLAAQTGGAIAGTWLAHAMFELPTLQIAVHVRTGIGQWIGEFVATFSLLAVVWSCARRRPDAAPWAVAAIVAGAYWFTSSTSFANPAVTLARAFTDSFAGIRPADVPPFVAAQALGAAAATALFAWFDAPETASTPAPVAERAA